MSKLKEPDRNNITIENVREAFNKLQSYVYFDNNDLFLRYKIAVYKLNLDENLNVFLKELEKGKPFESIFKSGIKLSFVPKKIECQSEEIPANYYTNIKVTKENEIEKPFIACDFPIELHLISMLWLMEYGAEIENKISRNALGNRLILNKTKKNIVKGRASFKPYPKQFQKWWAGAITATKALIVKNENATILNFDLSSFYHNVQFNFNELEREFSKKKISISANKIHSLLVKIHHKYRDELFKFNSSKKKLKRDEFPLPIGLLSSHLLANWVLRKLDKKIERQIRPVYYGRYVDDVLIVIKDTLLSRKEIKKNIAKSLNQEEKTELIKHYLSKYFNDVFEYVVKDKNSGIKIKVGGLQNLELNSEKLFVYQFDAKYSPNLIEKFVDEQKERSSMFRFLSDEEDDQFGDFDKQNFEANFDTIDSNKARFKNIEDNKYKLSTFFSKLIKRRIQKGPGYKEEEVNKIRKYFQSTYLIKHHFFWEKLFTIFVVYEDKKGLMKLFEDITVEIENIKSLSKSTKNEFIVDEKLYKKHLTRKLFISLAMAIGLNPRLLGKNEAEVIVESVFGKTKSTKLVEEQIKKLRIFRKTGLLRGAFIYYPLFQFSNYTKEQDFNLTSRENIFNLPIKSNFKEKSILEISSTDLQYIPFRVKFWQCALFTYYKNFITSIRKTDTPEEIENLRLWFTDLYSSDKILEEAFNLFYKINKPEENAVSFLRKEYFTHKQKPIKEDEKNVISSDRDKNFVIQELFLKNGGKPKDKYRICVVNQYVSLNNFEASLKGKPNLSGSRIEEFEKIWDQIAGIRKCDIIVMPELSLPHNLLTSYTDQVAQKQVGLISGIEHINIDNVGFNFILTALPIKVDGVKDAIPILRLKNHYAPDEEVWIRGKKMVVPKPKPYRYDLFIWRGLYFSSYYCYELADVFHRSALFSKVDVIFAPVWNKDTHYYNSLIDAATRDMHNYFVLVNTAQYGFSKIARPRDYVNKEKVLVKGGTEEEYAFALLVGDLKVKELREFQLLDFCAQQIKNKDKKSFKPTPPDFPVENVRKRIDNQSFIIDTD